MNTSILLCLLPMQTLLESLYSQQTTFGETDFSALCVHLNKHVSKRSLLVLYTNFSSIGGMNRQLSYLKQLNRQHRLLVVFFEDVDLKEYIAQPAKDTEGYYRHVIAEKFADCIYFEATWNLFFINYTGESFD